LDIQRWNLLHPDKKPKSSYVTQLLKDEAIPTVAATDYMKIYADQIREFVPGHYLVLGTDGFGRSDTRKQLRKFFEVNRYYIVVAALNALADEEKVSADKVTEAIKKYDIDPEKPNPTTV
jgi:pyruvate dehydrogenase E1 component